MIGATSISTILTDVLAACVAAYGQTGAPAVPSRQFISHGQPIWEGEQLTVCATGLSVVHPFPLTAQRAAKTTVQPSLGVSVEVVRACWPQPKVSGPGSQLPDPSAFTAAGLALAKDAATIFGWITDLAVTGGLIPSYPTIGGNNDVALGVMVPTGPQGLWAGWRWPISIKVAVPTP